MEAREKVRVAIGLCTYKRPQMVAQCITSLQALDCPTLQFELQRATR